MMQLYARFFFGFLFRIWTQKIDGEYDMDYVASLTQSQKFSVYRTDQKSVDKCVSAIYDVSHPSVQELETADKNKSRSFVINMVDRAIERIEEGIDGDN